MTVRLIQGFFFQEAEHLGVTTDGFVAVIREGMTGHMFAGTIYPDVRDVLGELTGEVLDTCGRSRLSNIRITEDELSFTKHYAGREDVIRYRFQKVEGIWVGGYEGEEIGGAAACIVTEAPDVLLHPFRLVSLLDAGRQLERG